MKVDVKTPIRALDGTQLFVGPDERDKEGKITKKAELMILADVLEAVALVPSRGNKTYNPNQQVMRWAMAIDVHKAREQKNSIVVISQKVIDEIKDDLSTIYAPIVGGQVLVMLGHKVPPDTSEPPEAPPQTDS